MVKGTDLKSVVLSTRRFEPYYHRFGLLAQLGERETEDLKVLRSIRSQPIFLWGCRSIGRSLALHARGRRIEAAHFHIARLA